MKTPFGDAPGVPVALTIVGAYLAWFGVHYWMSDVKWPTDPIKSALTGGTVPQGGADLSAQTASLQINPGSGGGATVTGASLNTGTGTGSAIANDALKYKGTGYVYAGNASSVGDWDCSSFVSYVLGHDLGYPLPGGKWGDPGFPPHSHGPTTIQYLLYGEPLNADQVQAGDLCVWETHMGIMISNDELISAQTPKDGVGIATVQAMSQNIGELVHFRRVTP